MGSRKGNSPVEQLGLGTGTIGKKSGGRIWGVFYGMRSGMILLALVAALSILGTLIPQGRTAEFYAQNFSGVKLSAIQFFQLDRVYSAWWYGFLILILSINLILCNLRRFPKLLKEWQLPMVPETITPHHGTFYGTYTAPFGESPKIAVETFFKRAGFKSFKTKETADGLYLYASRCKAGLLGSWLSHLGLLLIIVFFFIGKLLGFEAFVYGVPGTDQVVAGTPYRIAIEAFDIEYRQDYSIHQYLTDLMLYDPESGFRASGRTQVNAPFRSQGMSIYQNGTGWALDVVMQKADGSEISRTLYTSEVFEETGESIALHYLAFYPDFIMKDGQPYTATPFLNRPVLLYSLFEEGRQVRTNVAMPGEPIRYGDTTFSFYQPRLFTVLQVVRDPGTIPAGIGGALLLMGLFLSFYWVPKSLYGFIGTDGKVWISGFTKKNSIIYHESLSALWQSMKMGE